MTREDVIEWLRYPEELRKKYDDLYEELQNLINNPLSGVSYDRIRTGKKTDLSDYAVKIEEVVIKELELLREALIAEAERSEYMLQCDIPHLDVLSYYFVSCYNPVVIAKKFGVCKKTIYRWIDEGLNAIMTDPILTAKICVDNKNSAENTEKAI